MDYKGAKLYKPGQFETFDANLGDMILDILQGDEKLLDTPEIQALGPKNLKAAIEFLQTADINGDYVKLLLNEGWRLKSVRRPPTPEEYLTPEWIGGQAESIWPNVKESFLNFLNPNPLNPVRGLALSTAIGSGKSLLSNLIVSYLIVLFGLMRQPYRVLGHSPMSSYAQPYSSLVRLKDKTYTELGKLQIGDQLDPLFDSESIVTVIFEKGIQDIFEVSYQGTESIKTRCSLEHWWLLWDTDCNKYVILQTKDMLLQPYRYWIPQETDVLQNRDFILQINANFVKKALGLQEEVTTAQQPIIKNYLKIDQINYKGKEKQRCIEVSDSSHLYCTKEKYSTNPIWIRNCIGLASFSISKSWDLLGTPFEQFIEQSPVFEKVARREDVVNAIKDDPYCEKIHYSTAGRGSARMIFRNNLQMKLMSTEGHLLGNAQPLYSKIMKPDGTYYQMKDVQLGDEIASPTEGKTDIIGIFPQGKRDIYEIELEDGRTTRAADNHLWKVAIDKDENGNWNWQIVNTLQLIKWLQQGIEIEIFEVPKLGTSA